jgi:multimeric flavodoxin WrbA
MSIVNELVKGKEYKIIHAYNTKIESCDDCKFCVNEVGCSKHEIDYDELMSDLFQAETLIIASPIYFASLSDQILKLINRFQLFFENKFNRKDVTLNPNIKNTILICTSGGPNENMFNGPKQVIRILNMLFSTKNSYELFFMNTDTLSPTQDKNFMEDVRRIANSI